MYSGVTASCTNKMQKTTLYKCNESMDVSEHCLINVTLRISNTDMSLLLLFRLMLFQKSKVFIIIINFSALRGHSKLHIFNNRK